MVAKQYDPATADWWSAALKAKREGRAKELIGSDEIPIHDGKPHYGFYRMRANKDGPFVPVAYWYDEGELRCQVNGMEQDAAAARGRWHWAAREPVSYEDYLAYTEALAEFRAAPEGKKAPQWPDEIVVEVGGKASSSHERKRRNAAAAAPAEGAEPKRRGQPKTKAEPIMRYFHQPDIRQLHAGYEHPGGTFKEIEKAEHDELAIQYANPVEEIDDDISDELDDDISDEIDDEPAVVAAPAAPEPVLDAKAIAAEVKARTAPKVTVLTSHNTSPTAEVKITTYDEAPPAAGHNSGGDLFAELRAEIKEWERQVTTRVDAGTPKDQVAADALADAKTKLGELVGRADAARLDETKPLRDRVDAINARWNGIIRPADLVKRSADAPLQRFIKMENERRAEVARKAAEAERAANPPQADNDRPAAAPPRAAPPAASAGGRRRVSTVKRRVVVIENLVEVATYFAGSQTPNGELVDLLKKLALKVISAGQTVPGARGDFEEGVR